MQDKVEPLEIKDPQEPPMMSIDTSNICPNCLRNKGYEDPCRCIHCGYRSCGG